MSNDSGGPTDLVSVERRGGVAVLTLEVPDRRNALSASLVTAIESALDEVENDAQVRCLVLTGRGPAFCAGAPLDTLRSAAAGDFDELTVVYAAFLRFLRSPLPSIAAVNGPAVGAGLNLALSCDLRIASTRARFDSRFAELRIHPGGGHTWLLTRAVGAQQAMRLCLFGGTWDAEEARATGLVVDVVPDEQLVDTAVELGNRLDRHERDYVTQLTATLRHAAAFDAHAEVLERETEAQRWSVSRPAFGAGVREIEERIAAGRR